MKFHLLAILWILITTLVIDTIRDSSYYISDSIECIDMDENETQEEKKAENEKFFNRLTPFFVARSGERKPTQPQFELVLTTQNIRSKDNQPPELV